MGFRRMVTTVPGVSDEGTAGNVSRLRLQKKAPNPSPSPSPRCRGPSISSRPPLSSCEKDNAASPKIPRGKDINSRYQVTSSPSSFSASDPNGGSLSSASTTSSSKGTSFTSSSCSASIASSSSSSTSTATSSRRRFGSNVPTSRPSSPTAMPSASLSNRSKSVDRNLPTETSTRCIARESTELSTAAARALRTTTRSLSVSFQGESFSYQTSKARLVSPSPIRKPTPERRTSIAPSFKSECSRPSENLHRWSAARTRSLNCSVPDNDSVLAAIRSLRQSMVLDEGARRASFDGGDFSLSFGTDSLSSGGNSEPFELNTRSPRIAAATRGRDVPARFLLEEGKVKPSPGGKCKASSKPLSSINGLLPSPLISSSPRPSSFGPSYLSKLAVISPRGILGVQRVSIGPARSFSDTVPFSCNAASMFGMGADIKRGKYVERQLEDAHRLRLLNNRHLQWRWVNAQMKDTFLMQKLIAEMIYLVKWSLVDQEHANVLSGSIEALKTSTICLPVVNGAEADFHEVRNAVGSAVDVTQAMGASICCVLPKVEGRSSMVSELSELAVKEQSIMNQCRDLLSAVTVMHVKQCSLLGHVAQLSRPSLIQL